MSSANLASIIFKKVGLIGAKRAITNFALRSIIFLLPPIIRMFIYKKYCVLKAQMTRKLLLIGGIGNGYFFSACTVRRK